jgi:S1-C subfamily serine protease
MHQQGWRRRELLAVLAAASAGCTGQFAEEDEDEQEEAEQDEEPEAEDEGAQTEDDRYARLYEETIDSLVLVQTAADAGPQGGGMGSGFVHDDYLLTNQHITRGAESVDVQFRENDWREATVVGEDVYADLAVLEVTDRPEYASPLPLTESTPSVGTEVVALGNPFGLDSSISAGIVSGVNRSIQSPAGVSIPDGIQTDAAVNPGNSGGPLVTLDGEVAGVITAGGGNNIGFAISAALVRRVAPALFEEGSYDHPYLGVNVIGVTREIAEANDLPDPTGVYVHEVEPDGPNADNLEGSTGTAAEDVPTGGDVLVDLAGHPVETVSALSSTMALELTPNETVEATVRRDGEQGTVELSVGTRPEPEPGEVPEPEPEPGPGPGPEPEPEP